MIHPKMMLTYVGIDSHRDTHTAVFLDCFYTKLGEISFENRPAKFEKFLKDAEKLRTEGTSLLVGMEDISAYGRALTIFLKDNGQRIKHVNAALVASERKSMNVTQKTDSIDAECAARVLLSKFDSLPDANPQDEYWILRTLVVRRESIIKQNISLKNHLHTLINDHYPSYEKIFTNIDCNSSLEFLQKYPSPLALKNAVPEELNVMLWELSNGRVGRNKAEQIFEQIELDGCVMSDFQDIRDTTVQSTVRQIVFNQQEIERLEHTLSEFLDRFDYPLTSLKGIDTVSAAQFISCIKDIKKFPTPAKLARYAGVSPVTYASGKKDIQYSNQRGNRELNSLFYALAVRVSMPVGSTNKVVNPFFFEYYSRKLSEGKTKNQALKCVQRRLVNIIWNIMSKNEEYINPPSYDLPKENKKESTKKTKK